MEDYEFAKRLAELAHHRQRYGTHPYTHHLKQVDTTLCNFGFKDDMDLRIAAWLHDIIEDTGMSYDQIKLGFGEVIADIVYAVTNEMGRNRKERYSKTFIKIKSNKKALILKLADRIVNITMAFGTNSRYIQMYRKEAPDFWGALYEKDIDDRVNKMWEHLDGLLQNESTDAPVPDETVK